jgi:hypothetical protein
MTCPTPGLVTSSFTLNVNYTMPTAFSANTSVKVTHYIAMYKYAVLPSIYYTETKLGREIVFVRCSAHRTCGTKEKILRAPALYTRNAPLTKRQKKGGGKTSDNDGTENNHN